jgi:hypothetical protein
MPKPLRTSDAQPSVISHDELLRIVGDIDESRILAILALRPTVAEVEEAALWATGSGDVVDRAGHPLTGVVAEVFEILTSDEEEPPRAP